MIPRRRMTTYPGMAADVIRCLLSGSALRGAAVRRFENAIARRSGVAHAIAVSSGRFGLQLILRHLDLAPGAEVIVPAYTLGELPAVIAETGLVPVLADVAPGGFNCRAEQIAAKVGAKTAVILLTHMNGESADVAGTLELARRHGLVVVEDNAHGIGVQAPDGRPLGSLGHAGFVSLETRKVVNTFGGGAVVTDDARLAGRIRHEVEALRFSAVALARRIASVLVEHASLTRPLAPLTLRLLNSPAFNRLMIRLYRAVHRANRRGQVAFTNLQAVLGLRQMERLDETIRRRRELARLYLERLASVPDTVLDRAYRDHLWGLLEDDGTVRHNVYALVLRAPDPPALARKLRRRGVDVGIGTDVCDDLPARYDPAGSYPNTRAALSRGLQLPMYSGIRRKDVEAVCDAIGRP